MNFHSKKIKYWIQASRIETLPLSISGIILGSFYAFYNYSFDKIIFVLSIITAISFQILSNFANDYGDGVLGTDNNRIGPKRVIASGKLTLEELKKGIIVNVFISIAFSVCLISVVNMDIFNSLPLLGIFAFAAYKSQPALSNVLYGINSIEYGSKIISNLYLKLKNKIENTNINSHKFVNLNNKNDIGLSIENLELS